MRAGLTCLLLLLFWGNPVSAQWGSLCPAGSTPVSGGGGMMCMCPDGSYAGYQGCAQQQYQQQPRCPAGTESTRYGCTPQGAIECGGYYCNPGTTCASGHKCMPVEATDCGNGRNYCNPGYRCSRGGGCVPSDHVDCGHGFSCPNGLICEGTKSCLTPEQLAQKQKEEEQRKEAARLKIQQEREAARRKEEERRAEIARKKQEAEANRQAEIAAKKKAQEERLAAERRKEEERQTEIARKKQETEARRQAEIEAKRKAEEARLEAIAKRKAEEYEASIRREAERAAEVARKKQEAEDKRVAEIEAKRKAEEEKRVNERELKKWTAEHEAEIVATARKQVPLFIASLERAGPRGKVFTKILNDKSASTTTRYIAALALGKEPTRLGLKRDPENDGLQAVQHVFDQELAKFALGKRVQKNSASTSFDEQMRAIINNPNETAATRQLAAIALGDAPSKSQSTNSNEPKYSYAPTAPTPAVTIRAPGAQRGPATEPTQSSVATVTPIPTQPTQVSTPPSTPGGGPPTPATQQPITYTYKETSYKTIEIYENGKRIATVTPDAAVQNYGYKTPVASSASITPTGVKTVPIAPGGGTPIGPSSLPSAATPTAANSISSKAASTPATQTPALQTATLTTAQSQFFKNNGVAIASLSPAATGSQKSSAPGTAISSAPVSGFNTTLQGKQNTGVWDRLGRSINFANQSVKDDPNFQAGKNGLKIATAIAGTGCAVGGGAGALAGGVGALPGCAAGAAFATGVYGAATFGIDVAKGVLDLAQHQYGKGTTQVVQTVAEEFADHPSDVGGIASSVKAGGSWGTYFLYGFYNNVPGQ